MFLRVNRNESGDGGGGGVFIDKITLSYPEHLNGFCVKDNISSGFSIFILIINLLCVFINP